MADVNTSYQKSSFGPAFLFIPSSQRQALAAYYEFCRLMDDIADEPNNRDPLPQLEEWQQEITRIFNGTAQTPLGQQLSPIVHEFGLSPGRFSLLIEGMRADVEGKTYSTWEDLDGYLYRVAVIVGLATLDIVGIKGDVAQTLAGQLGRAVQLTNIIRDVPDDARLNRVYLPTQLLQSYGLTRQDILSGKPSKKLAQALATVDERARLYYQQAEETMARLPKLKMLPCRLMGCVYAQNLAKIRKRGFWFETPIKLTKTEKLKGVFHALCKTMWG